MTFSSIFTGQNPSSFMTQLNVILVILHSVTEYHRHGDLNEEIPFSQVWRLASPDPVPVESEAGEGLLPGL